jgi:hypothetical protein
VQARINSYYFEFDMCHLCAEFFITISGNASGIKTRLETIRFGQLEATLDVAERRSQNPVPYFTSRNNHASIGV